MVGERGVETDYNGIRIFSQVGDITKIKADALLLPLNPQNLQEGSLKQRFDCRTCNAYSDYLNFNHDHLGKLCNHLDCLAAHCENSDHDIGFRNVVFVADALESPLSKVVYAGLNKSKDYESILLPCIRMGNNMNFYERGIENTVSELIKGIKDFSKTNGSDSSLKEIGIITLSSCKPYFEAINNKLLTN